MLRDPQHQGQNSITSSAGPPRKINNPIFSVVLKGLPQSISPEKIQKFLTESNLPFKSYPLNTDTMLFRIIMEITHTQKTLLNNGLHLYGCIYRALPAPYNPLPVARRYCSKCTKYGHEVNECSCKEITCPNWEKSHSSRDCQPQCSNWGIEGYPSYSFNCPAKQKIPSNKPEQIAPIRPNIDKINKPSPPHFETDERTWYMLIMYYSVNRTPFDQIKTQTPSKLPPSPRSLSKNRMEPS